MSAATSDPRTAREREMLRAMIRIRLVEETIAARYGDEEIRCPTHLSIGQEAVAAGVCAALVPSDYVLSTHRGHAHYLAKGGSLDAMIAELHGRATGCASGWGGSMHLIDREAGVVGTTPIVGGSVPVAVGTAFASSLRGEPRVTAVFFGDGMTEEGVFAEALNFAALHALPILFVCEDNAFSVYSPLGVRQAPGRDRVALAAAHGLAARRADGNDATAVYAAAADAVARARAGEGPTYLEFTTYRWREHCGPNVDDDLGYRDPADVDAWLARCPIAALESRLSAGGGLTRAETDAFRSVCRAQIDAAFARALSDPWPDAAELRPAAMYAEPRR